jgi:radical SAM superfamily enzyme YgiQ (UPF0313 family)
MGRMTAAERYDDRRRALLGSEVCMQPRNSRGVFETVLAYPNTYDVGMASLGFQRVFSQLASWPDTICERAFMPEADELNWRKRSAKPAVTLESGRSIKNCDLLAFSIQYEPDYLNVLQMLKLSGVAVRAADRTDNWPILIAGGLTVTANPMPLASFFDIIVIGESEPSLGPVLDTIKSLGSQGAGKKRIMKLLSDLPGIYIPSIHGTENPRATIMRQWASFEGIGAHSCFVAPQGALGNLILLEIARGCPFNCRFCLPGYAYLPYREGRIEDIQHVIAGLPRAARLGLVACSPDSHPQLGDILKLARSGKHEVSIGSQRAEDPVQLEEGGFAGTTLTIAPETGSDGLRRVVGKSLRNESVLKTVEGIGRKVSRIRMYFIYGFPFETDEDRASIPALVKEVRRRTNLPITLSINPFVPKPWTAFQWTAMADVRCLRRWRDDLTRDLRRIRGVEVKFLGVHEAHIQALLARGDHRTSDALIHALEGDSWSTAFTRAGIDPSWVFSPLKPGAGFEWDFLNMGFGHTRLARELNLAISANQARMKPADRAQLEQPQAVETGSSARA